MGSVWLLFRKREGLDADVWPRAETARAALWRPTDVDDFVFAKFRFWANSATDRAVGTLRFDTTPIDTALRPVSVRTDRLQK